MKLNPDVDRKKITNVVLENNQLKEQIKELIEQNDKFRTQIEALESINVELKKNHRHRPSIVDQLKDFNQSTHRDVSRQFEMLDISELDLDKSAYDTNQIMDIKKLLSLKDDFPDVFTEKLLSNYNQLERKIKHVNKEMKIYKKKLRIEEEKYKLLSDNYKKLKINYEKTEQKRKQLESIISAGGGGTGTPYYLAPKSATPTRERESISIKPRKQNVYDVLNNIKSMGNNFLGERSAFTPQFQDLSSILVTPKALDEQQNLSSEEEDIEDNENILEEVEGENEFKD